MFLTVFHRIKKKTDYVAGGGKRAFAARCNKIQFGKPQKKSGF
jgi:hypothetical protein